MTVTITGFTDFMALLAFMFLAWFVFWQRHIFLYIISVPVFMVFGLYWSCTGALYSPQWAEGIVITIIGIFALFRAVNKSLKGKDDSEE